MKTRTPMRRTGSTAIKKAWGPDEDFDFDGAHIKLKKVRAKPKPYGGTRPLIMNAGSSGPGQAFAMRNCDAYFTATSELRKGGVEVMKKMVAGIKGEAAAIGREIEVFTVGQVICRPTQKEAEDYYRYAIIEQADWGTVDGMLAIKNITPATVRRGGIQEEARVFRLARDRRLSVRRLARSCRRGACLSEPRRHPRHRLLDDQLSRRVAVLPRRGAAAPCQDGRAARLKILAGRRVLNRQLD